MSYEPRGQAGRTVEAHDGREEVSIIPACDFDLSLSSRAMPSPRPRPHLRPM